MLKSHGDVYIKNEKSITNSPEGYESYLINRNGKVVVTWTQRDKL